MKKIRLKYPVYDFNLDEIIFEVGSHLSHDHEPEPVEAKRKEKSVKPSAPPSQAQRKQREGFKLAEAYAREVLSIPLLRARYEKMGERQGKSPKRAAMADYLRGNDLLSKKDTFSKS